MRLRNTNQRGGPFSHEIKSAVWAKARIIRGVDPNFRRLDRYGAIIEWLRYGEVVANGGGWEIDHIKPVAAGGTDALDNLQPLQWQNNREKSNTYPYLGTGLVRATAPVAL